MKKAIIAAIIFLAGIAASAQDVWQSTQVSIPIGIDTATKWGMRIPIPGSTSFRMSVLTNDVNRTGFGGDSIAFSWGYGIESVIMTASGTELTYRDSIFVIDSVVIANVIDSIDTTGVGGGGKADTLYTTTVCTADTLSIPGYAFMKTAVFTPGVRQFLVPFVKPKTGQRKGKNTGDAIIIVQRVTGAYQRK